MHTHKTSVTFYLPSLVIEEVRRNLLRIEQARGRESDVSLALLDTFIESMQAVGEIDPALEAEARARMHRHPNDWHVVAAALQTRAPIWTDDRDFFGCGVATWSTATVPLYLSA